jgi:hypothetical protein
MTAHDLFAEGGRVTNLRAPNLTSRSTELELGTNINFLMGQSNLMF